MPSSSQKLLQITSIIMIVGGGIAALLSILSLFGAAVLIAMGVYSGLIYLGIILSIAGTVFQLIAGIKGVSNYMNPPMAPKLFNLGLIVIGLAILGQIISIAAGGTFGIVGFLLGLILPGLYTYAAYNIKTGKP